MGRRRCCETPTITAQAGSGVGKGYTCGGKRLLFLACEGQRHAAAAIALRAACSGIEITDSKQNKTKKHHSICSYSMPLAKAGEQNTSILSAGRTDYILIALLSAFITQCLYAHIFLYVYGAPATISITGASAHVNITAT